MQKNGKMINDISTTWGKFLSFTISTAKSTFEKKKKTYIDFWYHKVKSKKFIEKIVIEKY